MYCIETFENTDTVGDKEEVRLAKVYWKQPKKHFHNTEIIQIIQEKLKDKYGGNWRVRINSYMYNQSTIPRDTKFQFSVSLESLS